MTSCIPCAAGSFQTGVGVTACTACGQATYSTGSAMTEAAACTACDAGRYQTGSGATACTACDAGLYSSAGSALCTSCAAGFYSTASALPSAAGCGACEAGRFALANLARSCGPTLRSACWATLAWANGTWLETATAARAVDGVTTAASNEAQADDGLAVVRVHASNPPTAWTLYLGTPRAMSGVQVWAGASPAQSAWLKRFEVWVGNNATATGAGNSLCVNVTHSGSPPNPFRLFFGARAGLYLHLYVPTAAGLYLREVQAYPVGGSRVAHAASSNLCDLCSAGLYQTGTAMVDAADCTACPPGFFSTAQAAVYDSTCHLCAQGKYGPAAGLPASPLCPSGTYQTGFATTGCNSCDVGYYSTVAGAVWDLNCSACAPGSYGPSKALSACLACEAGSYSTGHGLVSHANCTSCQPGAFLQHAQLHALCQRDVSVCMGRPTARCAPREAFRRARVRPTRLTAPCAAPARIKRGRA